LNILGGKDQAGADAGGDIVGRDKITRIETHIDLRRPGAASKIEALKARLIEEMRNDSTATELIEGLQQYQIRRKPSDGVEGLVCKLQGIPPAATAFSWRGKA
jgi:hypothetical protein